MHRFPIDDTYTLSFYACEQGLHTIVEKDGANYVYREADFERI